MTLTFALGVSVGCAYLGLFAVAPSSVPPYCSWFSVAKDEAKRDMSASLKDFILSTSSCIFLSNMPPKR